MSFYKRVFTLFFCFVFTLTISSQVKNRKIAFKEILVLIETQHQVNFNYTENDFLQIKIIPPGRKLSLKDKLHYLEKNTPFSFENIDNKFINIFSTKSDVPIIICGYVYSNIDNSPLQNANVNFGKGGGVTTNKNGYFEFAKNSNTEFFISHIGYENKTVLISDLENKNCAPILLKYETTALKEINTNYFLTFGVTKRNNGSFEIKPKKLGLLPGQIEPDILQIMQQIPGINSTDESVSSINVRGGTHDQNLFLWNGIKMYQTGHFFGLISAFNPNLANTISVFKNGSSAFYGESVSSVIDISSNAEKLKKNSFGAGINMVNTDFYAKFNFFKKSFIEIASRKSITEYVSFPTYKEYFNKAFQNSSITNFTNNQIVDYTSDKKFNFYDITFKYSQKIGNKDHVILDLITIKDELKVFQSRTSNTITQSEDNTLYQKNYGGNLTWIKYWNPKNTSKINIYSSSYELDAKKNIKDNNQLVKQENKILDTGIKIENNHIISSKFTINDGYQFNEIGATNLDEVNSPLFYRNIKEVLRIHALVIDAKYNDSISKIYLNTGIRLNYIQEFKKYILEPRLQFNYEMSSTFNLEVLGEFKSQNSQQIIDLQKDYLGIEKRRWILSNNNTIPIQRSKQLAVNITYSKNNWILSIENFYKKISGITSSSQAFLNQLEFIKINGDYTVFGTELLLQKKINHFMTWISYTYNDNNYNFKNYEHPIFSNNYEMDHVISWAGIYNNKNLNIALGSKWHSGRPETTPINTTINNANPIISYNTPNNKKLSSFFQIDFSTTYKWINKNNIQYNLGLSVLNIMNRKNEINEFYIINSTGNSIEDVKTYSLRRTPNLSLRVSF